MELAPDTLTLRIDEREGVATEAVHVAETVRDAAVAHHDGDLVESLGQGGPEIPVGGGAVQTAGGVSLDGVVQVGKLAPHIQCVIGHTTLERSASLA